MFICCYCTQSVDREDPAAVGINVWGLWRRDPPSQALYAHSACLEEKFAPALDQSIPFIADIFGD